MLGLIKSRGGEIMILKYIEKRKKRKEREQYDKGYDWAAGILLRSGCVEEVESYTYGREYHIFDSGAIHAVRDFIKLKNR